MIISLNWLKKFTNVDMPVDELATLIGACLVEIEEVVDLGAKYRDVIIVRVVECNSLEGSDHLSVTKIDDGGITTDIERDEKGLIQVVCGAPNVKSGQLVAWLPPKSTVPQTYGSAEPFILGSRNLRGVMSNGMIASARELDLFDEHDGILQIDEDITPGTSFAKTYELDDYLLNIENKSLTHRPDCFGIIGFAREVAAITGKKFISPDWVMNLAPYFGESQNKISVIIDDVELSDRYQAIVMTDGDSKKCSPMLIQTYLARVGVRPINAIVDTTNYLMMLTGQPLHAFDFDKMAKAAGGTYDYDIHVRAGHDKERLELLDGRVIELTPNDIVIAAGNTAVGLAGAMGGASTVIDENTKSIIIESATFNLYKLRATQMRHGIFSEAITRFTKGQPAELTAPVLSEAVRLIKEWTGAQVATAAADIYPGKKEKSTINIPLTSINNILGTDMNISQAATPLRNAEFDVNVDDSLNVITKVPYWRSDVHIIEDVVEEIGRINGFDNIKSTLPTRNFDAVRPNDFDNFRTKIRKTLVRAGANEVLTYSFVHGDILQKAGQDAANSYRIVNSISPDLQYYRQTLTPSLLDLVYLNIKQGYDNFVLFEINKTHFKQDKLTDEGVPIENDMIALVVANKNKQIGASYYKAKKLLDYLCKSLGLELSYKVINNEINDSLVAPFEYRRSAQIVDKSTGLVIGIVGEYKKSVIKGFKLSEYTAGFEINARTLFEVVKNIGSGYKPISRYPASERDICFQVSDKILYSQIINAAENSLKNIELEADISPVDIYKSDGSATKNITIRIKLTSHDHTLKGDEVSSVIDSIITSVTAATNATVI